MINISAIYYSLRLFLLFSGAAAGVENNGNAVAGKGCGKPYGQMNLAGFTRYTGRTKERLLRMLYYVVRRCAGIQYDVKDVEEPVGKRRNSDIFRFE